ncbi:hypothetical protein MKY95_19365 [Paenibacillus sp. FSL P4-0176]|uniref:hypothetical protein n=1 Tax=Paenibacillus sp. FSL P4-0176 TaxID=2921631 RepID=UPI0030D1D356
MYEVYCKECNIDLTFKNIKRLADLDGERIGLFCSGCFPKAEKILKERRFVEEYKGIPIYLKDNKFGFWGATYYFSNLDDARVRVDNRHIAFIDTGALKFMVNHLR